MEDFEAIHPDSQVNRHQDIKNWETFYYAASRLIDECTTIVATQDGEVIGLVNYMCASAYGTINYETVEDEAELRYAVKELMGQQAFTKKRSRNRRFVFDIAMFVLTAVAIMGNSWFIRYYEASVFEHEMICYSLLAVCVCIIYNRACMTKPSAVSACLSFGFAILFTLLVFLLNNWWRYLYENTRFYWNVPYRKIADKASLTAISYPYMEFGKYLKILPIMPIF